MMDENAVSGGVEVEGRDERKAFNHLQKKKKKLKRRRRRRRRRRVRTRASAGAESFLDQR